MDSIDSSLASPALSAPTNSGSDAAEAASASLAAVVDSDLSASSLSSAAAALLRAAQSPRLGLPATHLSAALEAEIKAFCSRSNLTPRETDIFSILIEGVVRIKDVAVRLKLSPNTINNHVNSIFTKTKTTSKSQLLAGFLGQVTEELDRARFFRRSPRVLALTRDISSLKAVVDELIPNGFQVRSVATVEEFYAEAIAFCPPFMLIDLSAVGESTVDFLQKSQSLICPTSKMLLFGKRPEIKDRAHAMHLGAMDLIEAPFDVRSLYVNLMCQYIEDDTDRERFLRLAAPNVLRPEESIEISSEQVGAGGLSLSSNELDLVLKTKPQLGDLVELKLKFRDMRASAAPRSPDEPSLGMRAEDTITAQVQIVWRSQSNDPQTGLRFIHVQAQNRKALDRFTGFVSHSSTPQKSVRSFIPCRDSHLAEREL
jgi:DNA-binding CsgD family transcriptional regulator/DNA-binding response OmpR family regulator